MKNIATIPSEDRNDLFRSTASNMKMTEAVVEKDFWVCFMLDYLQQVVVVDLERLYMS